MKKTVTLLCFSLFLVASVQGQSCPTRKSNSQPAKTKFARANLPLALKNRPELLDRIQALTESSSACLMLAEIGLTPEQLYAADGELISILDQNWQQEMWVDENLRNLGYDENGLLATYLDQIYVDGQWVNESFFTLDFNQDGVLIGETQQDWKEGAWVNALRTSITLDEFGNEIQVLEESWNGAAWVGDLREVATVNEQGLVVEVLTQTGENGVWVNEFKDEYEYDEQGRETVVTLSIFIDATMDWDLFYRFLISYPNDATVLIIDQLPTGEQGAIIWEDFARATITFNEQGNPVEEFNEIKLTVDWENSDRLLYTYDAAGNLIEDIYQTWNTTEWVNEDGFFDTYDGDNDILISLYRLWENDAWVNYSQSIYSYGDITASESEPPFRAIALNVFPSPARERVHVNIELPRASSIQVDVYDLLGRHVANIMDGQAVGSRELYWEPAQLPAGIYFIRLQVDEQLQTRSVVVMR